MRQSTVCRALLCLALVGATACLGIPPERIEFHAGVPTLDGLKQVETKQGPLIFLRPGIEMKNFSQVLVDPFMVSYGNPRGAPPDHPVRTLDRETETRLTEVLRQAFIDQMKLSRNYVVVEEPGPQAIRVQGWLYDVVVDEPPTDDRRNFPLCFAQMTVITTVRHSVTAQALARGADRVNLSCGDKRRALFYSARWSDVSDAVKPWARILRRWLETLRAQPPLPN